MDREERYIANCNKNGYATSYNACSTKRETVNVYSFMTTSKKQFRTALLRDIKKLTSPQGYLWAGYPHYKTLFGRDSLITGWQMLEVNPDIARSTLLTLARLQGTRINHKKEEEPGRILHEHRTKTDIKRWVNTFKHFKHWGFPYYGSIDSTPLFLIVGSLYVKVGDSQFLKKLWPHMKKAVRWMEIYGDRNRDSFIEYKRKNPYGLYHQAWRDSTENHLRIKAPVTLVEVQGYAHRAYSETADMARYMHDDALATHLEKRAKQLKEKFNRIFWSKGSWILALDGDKKKINVPSSNQGHLLISDIIDEARKRDMLVERLFAPDLWTPYGIRTLSMKMSYFDPRSYHLGSIWPHDNWFIYRGLLRHGYKREAGRIKEALFYAYRKLGHIPEYYGVRNGKLLSLPGCTPQAWASAALLDMVDEG